MKTYRQRTNEIQEKLQQERRNAQQRRHSRLIKLTSIAASAAAFVLLVSLVLFLPYPAVNRDVSQYKDSSYYDLIVKLDSLVQSADANHPKNNFEAWFGGHVNSGEDMAPDSPADSGDSDDDYREVTDNQVDGVVEGDLFKRTENRIFYLRGNVLLVYSIAGKDSTLLSETIILNDPDRGFYDNVNPELYLNADGTRATVILSSYDPKTYQPACTLVNFDVTDEPKELNRAYISGSYVSSRYVDGQFLLISSFYARSYDYADESTFVPQTGNGEDVECLPMENLYLPEDASDNMFTVVCTLDDELNIVDRLAFLGYSSDVYVSKENLFISYSHFGSREQEDVRLQGSVTTVTCVSYTDQLTVKGDVTLNGTLNNRYSLDEKDGVLRAFTTTRYFASFPNGYDEERYKAFRQDSADLYCVDLSTFEIIASVERFCPLGESVRSVRFDGDTAYVCTAIVYKTWIADPVYAFDLSDYQNITYKDTGTIPGYSLNLTTFSYDTLLGIGYGDDIDSLKIELYRERENDVLSVAKYINPSAQFSEDYKSYCIDRERGLIGLEVTFFGKESFHGYLLLRFNGYDLMEVTRIETAVYDGLQFTRSVVIDDYLYVLTPSTFTVEQL